MVERMRIGPAALPPSAPPAGRRQSPAAEPARSAGFEQALQQALAPAPLRISAHAQDRLRQRPLNDRDLERVAEAVDRVARKGAREALVLMRDLALVVSVANRTVITAVSGERMKENVFTQIDSAVIVEGE